MGGITGVIAMSKHTQLKQACTDGVCDPTTQGAALDSYHLVGNVSTVGFIVGGVGVAAGAVLLLTQPKESAPPTAATWSPFIGVGSAGVRGKF